MRDSDVVPLDCCLNAGRPYVQGSQMIARAADALSGDRQLRLRGAEFHAITDRCVGLRPGARRPHDLGEVVFEGRDGPVQAAFVALADPAPSRTLGTATIVTASVDEDRSCAALDFENVGHLRDLLDLAVQATKRLHLTLSPRARDIWLTGLRKADLPARWNGPSSGSLSVQVVRRLVAQDRVQSLNAVTLTLDGDSEVRSFVLTFAHREDL